MLNALLNVITPEIAQLCLYYGGCLLIIVIGLIVIALLGLASIVFVVFLVIGIMNACSGEPKKLPIIGGITILK